MNRTRAARRSLLTMTVALLATAGCQGSHKAETAAGAPVSVRAVAVVAAPVSDIIEAAGSLHGASEAVLAAKVMGTVIEIRKTAGQSVRRGEILVVLDDREVAGNIGQAEGALAQAKAAAALAASNLQRFEQLKERGAASQLELDQARFAHETALGAVRQGEAAVATASSYRNYASIPAPFDGQVVDRMVEVGDLAAPGRPLMRVEDASRLTLHVSLSETQAHAAQPGGQVEVSIPSLADRTWTGTVAEIVPAVDTATRTQLVKIDLPQDAELRSGLFARARFTVGQRQALSVPRASLVRRGGMTGVFVADGGHAAFRMIELADSQTGETLEVLSGLRAGDRVIVLPPATLTEGAVLEVQP
jgi:RND family efflux transporter MFP subunit